MRAWAIAGLLLLLLACAGLQAAKGTRYATRDEVPEALVNDVDEYVIMVEEEKGKYATWHMYMSEKGEGVYFYNHKTKAVQWHDPRTPPSEQESEDVFLEAEDGQAAGQPEELELGAGLDTVTSSTRGADSKEGGAEASAHSTNGGSKQVADATGKAGDEKEASSKKSRSEEDDQAEYYYDAPAGFSLVDSSATLMTGGAGLAIVLLSFFLGKALRTRFEHKKDAKTLRRPGSKDAPAKAAMIDTSSAAEDSPAKSTRARRRVA